MSDFEKEIKMKYLDLIFLRDIYIKSYPDLPKEHRLFDKLKNLKSLYELKCVFKNTEFYRTIVEELSLYLDEIFNDLSAEMQYWDNFCKTT